MTSRSDRVTVRLTHRQAELLRALAYQFHNTPTSLAGVYVLAGMDSAIRRGGALEKIDPEQYRTEILQGLRMARELGLVPAEPTELDPAPAN